MRVVLPSEWVRAIVDGRIVCLYVGEAQFFVVATRHNVSVEESDGGGKKYVVETFPEPGGDLGRL